MKRTIVAALCILFLFSMAGCGAGKSTEEQSTAGQTSIGQSAGTQQDEINSAETDQLQPLEKGQTIAIMKTDLGDIKIKFFPKEAPKAVENFINLSKNGYYNNLTFHRVMKDFMIQSGDPTGTGTGGESIWGKEFNDEFSPKLHNFRGALSMANTGANTNGSQFFIVQAPQVAEDAKPWMQQNDLPSDLVDQYNKLGGTPWLDNKHTVFGQVFEGMDAVDKIAAVEVDADSKPLKDVKILSVEITTQQ
jgi:peptidyl-prolyl cis-trans isomerase B (cyclophilin B)